jgi:biopolymer transport protein ExbD
MLTSHGVCLYSWRPDGCEWTIEYVWKSLDPLVQADIVLLALLLIYVILGRVSIRAYLAQWESPSGFSLNLCRQVEALRSIAAVAPLLGLVGTCIGILSAFLVGFSISRSIAMAVISARLAMSLIPTAAGILVAVPASVSYNCLRARLDALQISDRRTNPCGGYNATRNDRFAQQLPLRGQFSNFPMFSLLAALTLAVLICVFMTVSDKRAQGLEVDLRPASWQFDGDDRLIVLRITNEGKLFLNFEPVDWNDLEKRLSKIYGLRKYRALYISPEEDVQFQTLADAIGVAGSARETGTLAPLNITTKLITPTIEKTGWLKPVQVHSRGKSR